MILRKSSSGTFFPPYRGMFHLQRLLSPPEGEIVVWSILGGSQVAACVQLRNPDSSWQEQQCILVPSLTGNSITLCPTSTHLVFIQHHPVYTPVVLLFSQHPPSDPPRTGPADRRRGVGGGMHVVFASVTLLQVLRFVCAFSPGFRSPVFRNVTLLYGIKV